MATMPSFTSKREGRLWLWTLVTVVAIYATIPLAGMLVGFLNARGLLAIAFAAGMLLVAGVIGGLALRRGPGKGEFWVWLGIVAVYGMVWVRMENPAERTHLFEYGLVATLIYLAMRERGQQRQVRAPEIWAITLTTLLGIIDEGVQYLLPNRVFDLRDVGFNALAAFLAVAAIMMLAYTRRWRERYFNHDDGAREL